MKRKLLKTQLKNNNIEKMAEKTIHYYCATGLDNMTYNSYNQRKKEIHSKIREDILNEKYKFVRYKEKLILKNRYSSPRCISIPTLRDRLTNKIILETLKEYFPECARTKLPQECIKEIKEIMELKNFDYFIKLDLSNFYGNIDHAVLLKKLRKRIKDKKVITLIMKAIQTPTAPEEKLSHIGVPQGLSISNILSQIYMMEFDDLYKDTDIEIYVVRFVDDIIILCHKEDFSTIYEEFTNYLKEKLELKLNSDKEEKGLLYQKSFDYLGYNISINNRNLANFRVKQQNIHRLEKRLMNLITRYKYQKGESGGFSTSAFIFELNIMIAGTISS